MVKFIIIFVFFTVFVLGGDVVPQGGRGFRLYHAISSHLQGLAYAQGTGAQGTGAEASVQVLATVDRTQMQLGDTLTFSLEVSASQSPTLNTPQITDQLQSPDFDLLNQWQSTQSSHVYSNGQLNTRHTKLFNFMLKPKKLGSVSIPSLKLQVGGQAHSTEAIVIQVQKHLAQNPQGRGQGQGGSAGSSAPSRRRHWPSLPGFDQFDNFDSFDDLFSNFLRPFVPRPQKALTPEERKNLFFIHVEVDKAQAYEGEQITATWSLYTKTGVQDIDTLKYPSLKGFWKEDLFLATRLNFSRQSHKGIAFRKARLASFALFALKPGEALIDTYRAKLTLSPPHRWGKSFQITNQSVEKKVNILAVPAMGQPDFFTDGVGEFKATRRVDKHIQQGQVFSINFRFEGRGNAKRIHLPDIKWPSGLDVYDTKSSSHFFKTGRSHKEFEVLLVPNRAGRIRVPELQLAFFNPSTKQYDVQVLKALDLDVTPTGTGSFMASYRSFMGGEGGGGVAAPQLLMSWQGPFYMGVVGWLLAFAFVGCLFLAQVYWRLKMTRKSKWCKELALKKKNLQTLLQQKKWKSLGVEAANTLSFVVGHMAHANNSSRWRSSYASTQPVAQMLQDVAPSFRRRWGSDVLGLSHDFEQLAFAPSAVAQQMHNVEALRPRIDKLCKLLDLCLER